MEQQTLINILIGASGFGFSFILARIWSALGDLQKRDEALTDKLAHLEVIVAGSYVKQEQFNNTMNIVFNKLDKISEKLDHKADK